jgi:hypothetical protein
MTHEMRGTRTFGHDNEDTSSINSSAASNKQQTSSKNARHYFFHYSLPTYIPTLHIPVFVTSSFPYFSKATLFPCLIFYLLTHIFKSFSNFYLTLMHSLTKSDKYGYWLFSFCFIHSLYYVAFVVIAAQSIYT